MILNRLRLETRPQHEQLDHHPLMTELMSPAVSLSLYGDVLGKFLGFYEPLEPLLARYSLWSSYGIDFDQRLKIPLILQDLASLDRPPMDFPSGPTPDWIQDKASAMGTFYVIEGSTLGGQVIARHIASRLDLSPDHGLAFFSSYADAIGQRWKETRQALLRFSEQSDADEAMIIAARKTFLSLTAWLDN